MAWIMTSHKAAMGRGKVFLIGQVQVAHISKVHDDEFKLAMPGSISFHSSFADAMKEMHRKLREPHIEIE